MAYAVTSPYKDTTLAVEFTGGSGTYTTICGITSWSMTLNTQLDTTEVPDCSDLSLPLQVENSVRSLGATISASGVWSLSSHQNVLAWAQSGATKSVRVSYLVVTASGASTDTETLTGNARMTNLQIQQDYGQKMRVSFELAFDGVPTAVVKGP